MSHIRVTVGDPLSDEQVKVYLTKALELGGPLNLDTELKVLLKREQRFNRFKTGSGGVNRAQVLDFLTRPENGRFRVVSDGHSVMVSLTKSKSNVRQSRQKPRQRN
jgi:hypothetical protein